jgi:hypothetical protein
MIEINNKEDHLLSSIPSLSLTTLHLASVTLAISFSFSYPLSLFDIGGSVYGIWSSQLKHSR